MVKKFKILMCALSLIVLSAFMAMAQETTGSLDITVKDPNGAVVPNVAVTVTATGTSAGFHRTVTTDDQGFVRVLQVPPGNYSLAVAATAGFKALSIDNVTVVLGKTTPVNVAMSTTVGASVTVTGGEIQPLDPTDTKIQTTISAETAELLPKGPNFTSILKASPATRPEPRSGQFQIDGASGSENTFVIDGQEVTNVRTGALNQNSNLPFQIVQEVQIKSSGFEAEYGGATGGVVNLVTKGGNNNYHGEFGMQFRPSRLEPIERTSYFINAFGNPEHYPSRRDNYLEFNPTANLSGPIIKNKVWFFGSWTPQYFNQDRTLNYVNSKTRVPVNNIQEYRFQQINYYGFARIDAQPFQRLRVTATYNYNPIVQRGTIPGYSSETNTPPSQAGGTLSGAAFENQTGGRQNSQNYTFQGVWSATDKLIITGKAGHYFLNEKLGTYGQGNPFIPRVTCSGLSPKDFPAGFGCFKGFNNGLPVIENTLFDATKRNVYEADATYSFTGMGRHELKGGWQRNQVGNAVSIRDTDQIVLRYGQTIASYSGRGIPSDPNAVGAGQLITFQTHGNVTSKNDGVFIQDKWQPNTRLTFNLGVRAENENVPSFIANLPGIKFGWGSKIAPRLGVAYDLTGDGKTKVSAFYGWFYDRFKYELPRGSFGGDEYHSMFFEIFPNDTLASFTRASILGSGNPIPGGACPATLAPVYGKIRCDIDNRISSNSGGPLTQVGGIDPNIKPFRESELTFTFERQLSTNYLFSGRYTHKNVDNAIEDAGFPNSQGSEYYIIGNPGEGLYKQQADQFGLIAIKPQRKYDAVEIRLDRRFANNFYFNANYTYSRLFGNYSGLSSSDEEGRLSPNVNRYFDQPQAGWTIAGGPDNGLLATDRPHVFKFYGAYRLNWDRFGFSKNNETEFGMFQTAESGSLLTTFVSVDGIAFIPLTKRGDMGRTPTFTQTDFSVRHRYHFGNDKRYTLVADLDVLNLFNQNKVLDRANNLSINDYDVSDPTWGLVTVAQANACAAAKNNQPCLIAGYQNFQLHGAPLIAADVKGSAGHDPSYGLASAFQGPRQVRFGFRFIF
jgi:hypothetical protein